MIIIIDNYDSFTYNLYQGIANYYSDVRVFRNDKITVEQIRDLNPKGIILSPGPGRPEDAGICIELIQKLSPSFTILGVCLGHQAIGAAFGGKVIQTNEIIHGKPGFIFHHRDILFTRMSLPFEAARYHSLVIEKETLPKTLHITAENENGLVMAIKHEHYRCYGIQFHPESILTPEGKYLLMNFINICVTTNYRLAAC